jgi:molybdenum cofactor cytidylyltransferase
MSAADLRRIYPVVLAAGRSARMGQPKLLLEIEGKRVIALVAEACFGSMTGPPIIVLGHEADRLRAELPEQGLTTVIHEHYDLGMTSSLQAGLHALPEDALAFFLFPADFPLVTAADLRALAHAFLERTTPAKTIFMPVYRGRRGHPVLVDVALKDEFLSLSEEQTVRSRIYADAARVQAVEVQNRGVLMDLDTPADLAECRKEFRRQRGYTTRAVARHPPPDESSS